MGCRVGMSTDPQERINHWKAVEGHMHGVVLGSNLTYKEATEVERTEAANRGCSSYAGGPYEPGHVWSVYHVWGGTLPLDAAIRQLSQINTS